MSKISRFTSKAITLAKNAVGGRGEAAAPEGGGFADYAVVSLHCLRIYLEKSYREALDLLSEMPQILAEIGLNAADLPEYLWHLAQQIKCFSVGFFQVNPETVQRHHRILGEAATPFGGGDFASLTNSIFS